GAARRGTGAGARRGDRDRVRGRSARAGAGACGSGLARAGAPGTRGAAVLSLPPAVRIFVATTPTNMHLSFDRLAALARAVIQQDPLSGHLFVYRNRIGD